MKDTLCNTIVPGASFPPVKRSSSKRVTAFAVVTRARSVIAPFPYSTGCTRTQAERMAEFALSLWDEMTCGLLEKVIAITT